jgi:hypothetical protein
MGRQIEEIISSLTGGTVSINANLTDIEALLTTLQADVADGIIVTNGSSVVTNGTIAQLTTGTIVANIRDGSGNAIASSSIAGKQRLDVNLSSAGTIGTTAPTIANLYGGTDGTNLRAVSVDTSGRVNINSNTSTSGGTGPATFTSTSYGTIAASNTSRLGCTIFNEVGGNLYVTIGTATTSTSSYTVRMSPGDYYEVPFQYSGLIGGIFATAGTARVTEVS